MKIMVFCFLFFAKLLKNDQFTNLAIPIFVLGYQFKRGTFCRLFAYLCVFNGINVIIFNKGVISKWAHFKFLCRDDLHHENMFHESI